MKKLLLIIIIALCAVTANGQKKIGSYYVEYWGKSYDIAASEDENLVVIIDICGETSYSEVNFYLKGEEKINEFIESLKELRDKYKEWRQVARENNVKDFSKPFDITFPSVTVAWNRSKWWFDFYEALKPRFLVTEKGEIVSVISGEAKASSNEYITEKYYFVLSNVSEFDELISQIEPASVRAALDKIKAPTDLFK